MPFSEIICYDDNSTDNTGEVAAALGARVIKAVGPSTGPARARNNLAAAATQDWIHFHDADDLISPDFARKFSTLLAPDIDCVFCDADWVQEDTRKLVVAWRYDQNDLSRDAISYLIKNPVGTNNGVFRRKRFQEIGGFLESLLMWEDCDLYVRLAAAGGRMTHLKEVLTWSLRHTDSFSHDYAKSWGYRLKALQCYAITLPSSAMPAVALAAEEAASNLDRYGRREAALEAISLCGRLGHVVPATHNPLLRALRPFLPELWALRIQRAIRSRKP